MLIAFTLETQPAGQPEEAAARTELWVTLALKFILKK